MIRRSRLFVVAAAACVLGGASAIAAPSAELATTVQAVFQRSCAQCHGADLARPKAKFGFVTDLPRLAADPEFVVPGKPDESPLYTVLVATDEDELMPPPDSDAPKLTSAEIDSVRQWVLALAEDSALPPSTPAPTASPLATPVKIAPPAPVPTPAPGPGFSLKVLVAKFHPLVVHFPIALLVTALLAEIYAVLRRRAALGEATLWCLAIGALGSIAAVATGWLDAPVAGHSNAAVFAHRWTGVATLVAAFAVWAVVLFARKRGGVWIWVARLALLGLAGLVSLTGHLGGALVYGDDYLPF